MKKIFIAFSIVLLSFTGFCSAKSKKKNKKIGTVTSIAQASTQTGTADSQNQAEYSYLFKQIASINEYYTSMGAFRSSARSGHIVQYLQSVGTPTALKLLNDLRNSNSI